MNIKKYTVINSSSNLQHRIKLLQNKIRHEFSPNKYGYADLIKHSVITILDPNCTPQFCVVPKGRSIEIEHVHNDNYDCMESSLILKNWADRLNIPSYLSSGNIDNSIYHLFLEIPGYGYIGATPLDHDLRDKDINHIMHLSPFKPNDLQNDAISLMHLLPMKWHRLTENVSSLSFASMKLIYGKLNVKISVQFTFGSIKDHRLTTHYNLRLIMHSARGKNNPEGNIGVVLEQIRKCAAQNGEEGIIGALAGYRMKGFVFLEARSKEKELISGLLRKDEHIVHSLVMNIDRTVVDILKIDPEIFRPL